MADADRPFHGRLINVGYRHVYWQKEERYWEGGDNYWQVKYYWQTVKYYGGWGEKKPTTYVNFEALERMNLHFLQRQLLDKVAIYVGSGPGNKTNEAAEEISKSLHQYCKLVPTVPVGYSEEAVVAHACSLFLSFNALLTRLP